MKIIFVRCFDRFGLSLTSSSQGDYDDDDNDDHGEDHDEDHNNNNYLCPVL